MVTFAIAFAFALAFGAVFLRCLVTGFLGEEVLSFGATVLEGEGSVGVF